MYLNHYNSISVQKSASIKNSLTNSFHAINSLTPQKQPGPLNFHAKYSNNIPLKAQPTPHPSKNHYVACSSSSSSKALNSFRNTEAHSRPNGTDSSLTTLPPLIMQVYICIHYTYIPAQCTHMHHLGASRNMQHSAAA